MSEKKYIININKLVKDYLISRIIDEKSKNEHFDYIITFLILYHEKEITDISRHIYDLKNLFNSEKIYNMLDKFTKILLIEFTLIEQKKLTEKDLFSIIDRKPSKSTIVSNNIKVLWMANLQKENRDKYPTIYESQDTILEAYKQLAKDLDINSSLDLSHYFAYLLWNGYFSLNKHHSYQLRDRIVNHPTFEVFQGKGVCLNYSYLLRDFLQTCGKEARQVNCLVDRNHIKPDKQYKYKLHRNIDITDKESLGYNILLLTASPIVKKVGNHAMTLIENGKNSFYYDPTNILVLNPNGTKKAKIINGTGEFEIKQTPLVNSNNKQRFDRLIDYLNELFHKNDSQTVYTQEEVKETLDIIINKINNNIRLLNTTYKEIKPNILKINEEINNHIDELRVGFTKKKTK